MTTPGPGAGSGFGTDTEQLRRHAQTIAGKAGSVGTAAGAASHVADLNDAYGILCFEMGLPAILKGPQERCAKMIKEAQQELVRLEKSLHQAAKKYDEQEQELRARLRKILEDLGRSGDVESPGGGDGGGGPVPMPTPQPPQGGPQPAPMPTPTQPPGTPQPVPMPAPEPPDGGGAPPTPPAPTPPPAPMPSPPDGGGVPPAPMPQPAPMPNPTEPPQEV